MHLPKFEHFRAKSLDEVCRLLKEYGQRAHLVAGGTDLFPRMKYGLVHPELIVSMKGIPVTKVSVSEKGDVHLDALMTLAEICDSAVVREKLPMLAEAALKVGSNQVRHMGTLGGNVCLENRCLYYNQSHTFQFVEPCFKRKGDRCYLIPKGEKCWAVFCADTVPAMISLRAILTIRGPEGIRQLPLERLYPGDALSARDLSSGEIVAEVVVPPQGPVSGSAFVKASLRGGVEFAALTIAVVLQMDEDGALCREARITMGAVSAAPVRALKAEKGLAGQRLSDDLFQQVAEIAASEVSPVPHHGYSSTYLRGCIRIQTCRALRLAAEKVSQH
jgi:4-hydroxybenzoyl-CoA reductase beta subunit